MIQGESIPGHRNSIYKGSEARKELQELRETNKESQNTWKVIKGPGRREKMRSRRWVGARSRTALIGAGIFF